MLLNAVALLLVGPLRTALIIATTFTGPPFEIVGPDSGCPKLSFEEYLKPDQLVVTFKYYGINLHEGGYSCMIMMPIIKDGYVSSKFRDYCKEIDTQPFIYKSSGELRIIAEMLMWLASKANIETPLMVPLPTRRVVIGQNYQADIVNDLRTFTADTYICNRFFSQAELDRTAQGAEDKATKDKEEALWRETIFYYVLGGIGLIAIICIIICGSTPKKASRTEVLSRIYSSQVPRRGQSTYDIPYYQSGPTYDRCNY
ncbi:unnamed protein product [Enterobius vermicularis]|uniref:Transmembrane domain-containing protein n=1 Tax=Enterobius vermicularis TaxID=51028 RepID=A0A0N4VL16_ENTVE|nr:unnamed protein product [Enterobius vermicularis]